MGTRSGIRCRFGCRWSGRAILVMRLGGVLEVGGGGRNRLAPGLGHPPSPLRPEEESPSGERGDLCGKWVRAAEVILGCVSPSSIPQPPSFSQCWEKEGGFCTGLDGLPVSIPGFGNVRSWPRLSGLPLSRPALGERGGWGKSEGETPPQNHLLQPACLPLNTPRSPEGEGWGVRRSANPKPIPPSTYPHPQPKGAE